MMAMKYTRVCVLGMENGPTFTETTRRGNGPQYMFFLGIMFVIEHVIVVKIHPMYISHVYLLRTGITVISVCYEII